ncbi:copper chaperone [Coemansia spiralis]|uniref:Superoxide dismutase 1 copper chaperone n=1 Tax=Coemansia spiralis TaxID=417178 RepID=A0A9W8GLN2_9FUNG|nr:copper chaperone [Coemansia spiralis]
MPIKVQLAVDMTCQSCVDDINSVLSTVPGVDKIDISLDDKQVMVEGTVSPSAILKAIKDTGRSAVVRGTGSSSGGNIGAAVCIFEEGSAMGNKATRGLARFVQVDESTCFVDITVSGISDGAHGIAIHECGDLSQVPESCGGLWNPDNVVLDRLVVKGGWGDLAFETDRFKVWEVIGRSIVINAGNEGVLVGIVARSAGLFENDKQICACSGNTLWTEQRLVDQGQRL